MRIIDPLNDFAFLKMMGETGDEIQLIALLNAILAHTGRPPVTGIEIIESRELTPEIIGDKKSILDVRAVLDDGSRVNIESQRKKMWNMEKRSTFYASRELFSQLSAGQEYREITDTIAINILGYNCVPLPDYHTSYHLREDKARDYMLTSAFEIHMIEMLKFARMRTEWDLAGNPLHRWLAFLWKNTPEKTIREVLRMDSAIRNANERLEFILKDKKALLEYQLHEQGERDYKSAIHYARDEGIEIGIELGERKGRMEGIELGEKKGIEIGQLKTARNMISTNKFEISEIADLTGLPLDVIKKLYH
jgi:predicted transposase/invertase (TIGR01784 family)